MRAAVLLACLALAGCPVRYVAQDAHTGPDGESTGAERMKPFNGQAKSRGEVSFPKGDRVDWKYVELRRWRPEDLASVEIRLEWQGRADLSFIVYDAEGDPLIEHPSDAFDHSSPKHGPYRSLSGGTRVTGPIYIEVYAVGPEDAGTYKLFVRYRPGIDWASIEVPDPPRLGAVPLPICEGRQVPERDRCRYWPKCDTDEELDDENPNCDWFFKTKPKNAP